MELCYRIYLNSIIILLLFCLRIGFCDIKYTSNFISKNAFNNDIILKENSSIPTNEPSARSSDSPTNKFNNSLTVTAIPTIIYLTKIPTTNLTTADYSIDPSYQPTIISTSYLTNITIDIPTIFSTSPFPILIPTVYATISPSINPSSVPSLRPSFQPSTRTPSNKPSIIPTSYPTKVPTLAPVVKLTKIPTLIPTIRPTTIMPSKPTVDPTTDPTLIPSTLPTIIPTYTPTTLPSMQPSSQPSSQPTLSPTISQKPTPIPSRPTCRPTTIPSSQPTIQNSPKLKFFTNITFNNINETNLDYNAQLSIINTIARIMNILDTYITFHHVSYNEKIIHHNININTNSAIANKEIRYNLIDKQYDMIVTNKISLLLSSSSQYTSSNALYDSLILKLKNSFIDGSFSMVLREQSRLYNATILYSAIVNSITYSKLYITYPNSNDKKSLTIGDIIGIVICIIVLFIVVLCIIGYYYKEYYIKRQVTVYVSWKDEEKDIEMINMY